MFTKRIIPCLDVKNGRVVKGVNFVDLKDAGDPVEIAKAYDKAGADVVVFLDITASSDQRGTVVDMVRKVAANVFIPFTVGGGIRTVDDFKMLLREGADKISINSTANNNPQLNGDAAQIGAESGHARLHHFLFDHALFIFGYPEDDLHISVSGHGHRSCPGSFFSAVFA